MPDGRRSDIVARMNTNAVVLAAKGRVEVQSKPLDEMGPNRVMVDLECSTISPGTELAFLHGLPNTGCSWPMRSGYSGVGRVVEVGAGAEQFAPGQIVAVQAYHMSRVVVDAVHCCGVPASLDMARAAMHTIVGIALQGVRKPQLQLGESVAVLGLGIIGNLAGQLARAAGSTCVVGIDPVGWRQEMALSTGFDATASDAASAVEAAPSAAVREAGGFNVVIEATGSTEPIKQAFLLARRLGRVVLLGSTRGSVDGVDFYHDVHRKGLTIFGAHTSTRSERDDIANRFTTRTDRRTVLELLASGRVKVKPLISDTVPWQDAPRAYQRLSDRSEQLMTINLDWRQGFDAGHG
jgi:2-desacetyl-2-hydroxyethyl bacteriochlorophyllide A dehydrogenase